MPDTNGRLGRVARTRWGKACAACSEGKVKCMRTSNVADARCDRCERLDKHCTSQVRLLPKKRQQCQPTITVTVSGSATLDGEDAVPLTQPELEGEESDSSGAASPGRSRPATISPGPNCTSSTAADGAFGSNSAPAAALTIKDDSEDDETLLRRFRDHLSPLFPFVAIAPELSATELSATRPLLLSAIRIAASVHVPGSLQAQRILLLTEQFTERIMLDSAKSLELLQTILVTLAWPHHHHDRTMHSQMHTLTMLALALVAELGIGHPPGLPDERAEMFGWEPVVERLRTNDERRALCGVWYSTSMYVSILRS
jgi:hypothetical protein